eukprot:Blabericola_migrator_1__1373@NODE_1357_length_4726_cov_203_531015_g911_i0_p1_GENE_NODE_1357_length_4726_cov_203_531015_g911_i0NODE_1357_length_4726_cov_203_531015_g911_i0_p1_ORF_typecomplete_len836_score122_87DSPc/PF00782_20/1_5e29CDKN3/PF05706_12/8_2e05Y_phosphatase/PF00102_27/0_00089Y_phosphatase2/PF03162_13/6_6e03Y_phosphatase2/PF03162_13/0_005Init_tRNA_PT/PF04179_12/0_011DUF442/PF04273_13/0_52Gelsolin/PF00626_22/37Gelsolin/PF00626_22/29_NODE_1357_length_4726_cov_203_531015_g911_i019734480
MRTEQRSIYGLEESLTQLQHLLARNECNKELTEDFFSVSVVAGWRFDLPTDDGEPVTMCPNISSSSCCLWVDLRLSLTAKMLSRLSPTHTEMQLSQWHQSIMNDIDKRSRVRELTSLQSALSLELVPLLTPGLETYYIYCWEGKNALPMTRAKCVQAAFRLESALLQSFHAGPKERYISSRLFAPHTQSCDAQSGTQRHDIRCDTSQTPHYIPTLHPLQWFNGPVSRDLIRSLEAENRLLYRLLVLTLKPPQPLHRSTHDVPGPINDTPPLMNAVEQVVADIRSRAEHRVPHPLPSKKLMSRLILPASEILSVDGEPSFESSFNDGSSPFLGSPVLPETSRPPAVQYGGTVSRETSRETPGAQPPASEQDVQPHSVAQQRLFVRPTLPQLKSVINRQHNGDPPPSPLAESHRTSPHDTNSVAPSPRKSRRLHISGFPGQDSDLGPRMVLPPDLVRSESSESPSTYQQRLDRSESEPSSSSDSESNDSQMSSRSSSSFSESPEPASYRESIPSLQLPGCPPRLPLLLCPKKGVPSLAPLTDLLSPHAIEPDEPQAPPSRRSPEADRSTLLLKYKYVCSEIVKDQLYLAGESVASNLDVLLSNGITHILNSAGDTCPNYFPDKFNYLTFVLQDSRHTNEAMESVLFFALDFIKAAISSGGRVLVHCREGVSRSSTLVCAYLMYTQDLSFQAALDKIRSVRESCNPNTGFTFTLLKFGKRLETGHRGQGDIGDKKLSRVSLHHVAAPFLVVSGVSLWEPTTHSWMPDGKSLVLDPRFFYVLRVQNTIYLWKGKLVPRHMERLMRRVVERHVRDMEKYEASPPLSKTPSISSQDSLLSL